jgi:hypothetical protein
MSVALRQLLTYEFSTDSRFEGQLVGVLERVESGGALRILDALFVAREPDTGELVVVSSSADDSAGMVGRLLSFRLEKHTRRATTKRVLEGPAGDVARGVGANLEPGAAVAAILVEHTWMRALTDAVGRMGGTPQVQEFVEEGEIAKLTSRLASKADAV